MLAGHYGPALALRSKLPRVPLWSLFVAVQAVDVVFFPLAMLGVETLKVDASAGRGPEAMDLVSIPWTHSLATNLVYAAVLVGIGFAIRRRDLGFGLAIALFSHWALDLLVHFHDLPLAPGSEAKFGFGVWEWPVASAILEAASVGIGYAMLRGRLPKGAARRWGDVVTGVLLLTCVLYYVMPSLPSVVAMTIGAEVTYAAMTGLAFMVDRSTGQAQGA